MCGAWPAQKNYNEQVEVVFMIPVRDIPGAEIDTWVFKKKIEMLYSNQTQSWVLSILASMLIAYLAVESGLHKLGIGWWLVFVFFTALRTWNTYRFCRAQASQQLMDYRMWLNRFYIYTFLVACIWCVGGILIGSKIDPLSQVYIFIVLLGVSAAAIPLLGVVAGVMLSFQVLTTIPYLVFVAIQLGDRGLILVFMFGLYLIGVIYAVRRMDQNLTESLGLQYEKSQLANSLTVSNEELQHANEKLETLSQEDALTSLHNRRYFEMKLEAEWKREGRDQKILSLMVIDIDYFKLYNDTYGHAEGDECLKSVAYVLQSSLHRPADVIARIGGEEFVVLLPDVDSEGAQNVAQHMQAQLQHAALTHATSPLGDYVTISIGIASVVPNEYSTALGLFKAADKALYSAKAKGRNQIVIGEMEVLES